MQSTSIIVFSWKCTSRIHSLVAVYNWAQLWESSENLRYWNPVWISKETTKDDRTTHFISLRHDDANESDLLRTRYVYEESKSLIKICIRGIFVLDENEQIFFWEMTFRRKASTWAPWGSPCHCRSISGAWWQWWHAMPPQLTQLGKLARVRDRCELTIFCHWS